MERKALKDLADNTNITIRLADKGGAIALQDCKAYRSEILRQLADTSTYKKIAFDPTSNIMDAPIIFATVDFIPHSAGNEAMRYILSTSDQCTGPPIEFLLECLEFTLNNNYFHSEVMRYILSTSDQCTGPPIEFLLECLEFTLNNNYFHSEICGRYSHAMVQPTIIIGHHDQHLEH
ncbi:Hypothetical predicted protein [Pelobates cultripes]|uniref:Uncharacterized protein n=1 Tax=Pelobates cultripes TaxID=61616 RepID=A0AAD1VVG5_PELCU|nr:Hypothetical predicted protein [Pelobates cultripes]